MLKNLLLVFLLIPNFLPAQPSLQPQQIKFLYNAGRLWGNVKYFHPYLQYKKINWDSAFVKAVPEILKCKTAGEYAVVLQNLVSVLGDDATYASLEKKEDTNAAIRYTNTEKGKAYIQDSILILRLNNKAIADDYNETVEVTGTASNLLDSVKAVVMDLRQEEKGSRLSSPGEMNYEFATGNSWYKSLNSMLCESILLLPAERSVVQQGYKPEGSGGADYAYQPFFKISHSNIVNGLQQKQLAIVFLINKNVAVPGIALALQKQGKAIILSEDSNIELNAVSTINYTIDSVEISLRKTEVADQDGLLLIEADSVLPVQNDYNINLQAAIAMAKQPVTTQAKISNIKSSYTGTWKPDEYNNTSRYPGMGERVLAAAKMYSVIHFFNPDKDLFDNNWDSVFLKYLPLFVKAADSIQYMQAVAGMYSNMQDSHGFATSAVDFAWKDLFGDAIPTYIRTSKVEEKSVVSFIVNDSAAKRDDVQIGDVVLSVDGKTAAGIINEAGKYFPTSNNETKYRDISKMLLRGNDSTIADIVIQKPDGRKKHIHLLRSKSFYSQKGYGPFFKKEMPVCTILKNNIGYIDMLQLKVDNVDSVMNVLRNTKGIIFDDRSYPPAAAQQLFRYLPLAPPGWASLSGPVADAEIIANEYKEDAYETTLFYTNKPFVKDHKWTYKGKLVVLFNEWTQSYAEGVAKHLMNCGAVGIGSHTAGANGDVTNFNLPGKINLFFSGHRASMQRTGIIPDIKAGLTIKGIVSGKDEVLERAVNYLITGK